MTAPDDANQTDPDRPTRDAALIPVAPGPAGRTGGSWNRFFGVALAVAIAGMCHYLAYRHPIRRDVSRLQFYGLSEQTLSVLKTIHEPVEAILLFQAGQAGYSDIENLLNEYAYRCPTLKVSRVDPDREPVRTRDIMDRFPVTDANVVIFSSPGHGHRILERKNLFRYDLSHVQEGGRPVVKDFRGEQAITSALDGLFHQQQPVVYFIEGHGERPIDSYDNHSGFVESARRVSQLNMDVRALRLDETLAIPDDCRVLVIAGPRRRFAQPEVDLIGDYLLKKSGRLIVLLDSQTVSGLEPLLLRWGVRVGNDVVVDPRHTLPGGGLFIGSYGKHPIADPLHDTSCIFTLPRSITPTEDSSEPPAPDRIRVTRLASTTLSGWAETTPAQRPVVFDAGVDLMGPVCVAAAVEKGSADLSVQIRPTRLVVIGDSSFLANGNVVGANADLFLNSIHWMLDRPELMAIPPKSTSEFRLTLTADQVRSIGWIVMLVIPALAAGLGGLMAWRRRR